MRPVRRAAFDAGGAAGRGAGFEQFTRKTILYCCASVKDGADSTERTRLGRGRPGTERTRMTALRNPVGMTVEDFQAWQPEEHPERRWQLFDGEPVCMAPASENHGRIQAEATFLLSAHLRERRPGCAVVVAPGVVPRVRSAANHRIPDLGVTCSPPPGGQVVTDPVLLIEMLSPSNEALTRKNV